MANKFSFTLNSGSVMPALGFGTYAPQHVSIKTDLNTCIKLSVYFSILESKSACYYNVILNQQTKLTILIVLFKQLCGLDTKDAG